ncbi:MAG: PhoH family protein [Clostridia bacterium]|nr:PhoH family protein [Clostridia bacterium]
MRKFVSAWEKFFTGTQVKTIETEGVAADKLFGQLDENAKLIEKMYGVDIAPAPDGICVRGESESVEKAERLMKALCLLHKLGEELNKSVVAHAAQLIESGQADDIPAIYGSVAAVTHTGRKLRVKSAGQLAYLDAIKRSTVVIGIGPAGTGKTFLAVARAVAALRSGEVKKIILTRPAIEAGEKLGYLPGDLQMKVDPYLRPLYDALEELMGESYQKLIERGVLEIAPLAYMRGRTLKASFVILDEAQNTTCEQMRMFLTRLGEGSKMVVEGDETQIDLPQGRRSSGLLEAAEVLRDVEGIRVVRLTETDVVRHELVRKIVRAYEKASKGEKER